MVRLAMAAALVACVALPAFGQSSSDRPSGTRSDGSSINRIPGASGARPSDCAVNDPRPSCEVAAMPSDTNRSGAPSSGAGGMGSRSGAGMSGGSGTGTPSGQGGSSGTGSGSGAGGR